MSNFSRVIKLRSIRRFVERNFNYEKRWNVECRATTTTYRFLHDIANAERLSSRGGEKNVSRRLVTKKYNDFREHMRGTWNYLL